jgi:Zn-finger nucleic acid-binding protein
MPMKEVEYKGIKIDKCFSCDGVWLDAGELHALAKLEKGAIGKLFNMFKKEERL